MNFTTQYYSPYGFIGGHLVKNYQFTVGVKKLESTKGYHQSGKVV